MFFFTLGLVSTTVLANTPVSFDIVKGISTAQKQSTSVQYTTATIKYVADEKPYTVYMGVPRNFSRSDSDEWYQREASHQLSALQNALQEAKLLEGTSASALSHRIFQTLQPSTSVDDIVLQTKLPPLLVSEILEIKAIAKENRTAKDTIDSLSVALLASIGTKCFLAQYPIRSSQDNASEFGVWCKGEQNPKGTSIKDGVLIAQHPEALYPSMLFLDHLWERRLS